METDISPRNTFNLNKIPDEAIAIVLTYLTNHNDLKCARLISKKFYRASLSPFIIENEKFVFNVLKEDRRTFVDMLCKTDRRLINLDFSSTPPINGELTRFFRLKGKYVKSLHFSGCIIDPRRFWLYFIKCPNLTSLTFDQTFDTRSTLRYLNENVLNRRLSIASKSLRRLSINLQDSYNAPITDRLNATFPNVEHLHMIINGNLDGSFSRSLSNYFHRSSSRLKRIELSTLSDNSCVCILREIANVDFDNLIELNVNFNDPLIEGALSEVIKHQTKLQVLKFQSVSPLSDQFFYSIVSYLKNLKTLSIEGCFLTSLNGMTGLLTGTSIRHLSFVAYEPNLHVTYPPTAILKNDTLKELNLVKLLRDTVYVKWIICSFTNLTHLNLSYCGKAVTDETLQLISRNLKKLKVLKLSGCARLTDSGFGSMKVDEDYSIFCESLKHLMELDLSRCYGISDITVKNYLQIPSLRFLSLYGCSHISNDTFKSLGVSCPQLEILNLGGTNVDNKCLKMITRSTPRLNKLILYDSVLPSTKIFGHLIKYCKFLTGIVLNRSVYSRSFQLNNFNIVCTNYFSLDEELYRCGCYKF